MAGFEGLLRRDRRFGAERGATVVELAVALPILLMLVFRMVTSGLALFDKISLNGAAREAGRFGATYPEEDAASPDVWFVDVAAVAQIAATGALAEGVSGRSICVARGTEGGGARRYVVGRLRSNRRWCIRRRLVPGGCSVVAGQARVTKRCRSLSNVKPTYRR